MSVSGGDPIHGRPRPEPADEGSIRADERRRIARELHDSTSQMLTVFELELGQLRRLSHPGAEPLIEECERVIGEIRDHIRALDLEKD